MRRWLSTIACVLLLLVPLAAQGKKKAHKGPSAYEQGKSCYHELLGPGGKVATPRAWESCIAHFERAASQQPKAELAAQALFSAATLRLALYDREQEQEQLTAAVKDLNRLVKEHPESPLADDALYRIGCMRRDLFQDQDRAAHAFRYIVEKYPKGDMAPRAQAALASLGVSEEVEVEAETEVKEQEQPTAETKPVAEGEKQASDAQAGGKAEAAPKGGEGVAAEGAPGEGKADAFQGATLIQAEVEPGPDVTKVLLTFTRETDYTVEYTEVGARTQAPPRLDLVLLHTTPAKDLERDREVKSAHLQSYAIKRRLLSGGIKISFVLAPDAAYDIRRDKGLITIRFGDKKHLKQEKATAPREREPAKKSGRTSFRIVIDPGHGGEEEGAVGPGGAREKDVTLSIGKRLARELEQRLGAKVFLTRTDDRTLSLEERDAVAVAKKADLFISVHANAAESRAMSGVETYYLNNATDEAANRLAKRENHSSQKKVSQVEHIISTMLQNVDTEESREMASRVQRTLTSKLARFGKQGKVHDRGVRSALFYVLVGAKCPAILVETSFISNPREEKLLTERAYQSSVASAIADGVETYVKERDRKMVSL